MTSSCSVFHNQLPQTPSCSFSLFDAGDEMPTSGHLFSLEERSFKILLVSCWPWEYGFFTGKQSNLFWLMSERTEGCVDRSCCLVMERTTCSGDDCSGIERKGRGYQLSSFQKKTLNYSFGNIIFCCPGRWGGRRAEGSYCCRPLLKHTFAIAHFDTLEKARRLLLLPWLLCPSAKTESWARS